MNPSQKITSRPYAVELIVELAPEIGATVWVEEEYGFVGEITFKNGKRHLFRNTNFNVNPLGSIEIVKDKGYTSTFLRRYGYQTAEGKTFFSEAMNQKIILPRNIDDGWNYIKSIGFPVIIKPNNLSQGTGVQKIENKGEYYDGASRIFEQSSVMIIEKFYTGQDYRVVVFKDEVISAYTRIPLCVVGDGINSISELIDIKQSFFIKTGRDTVINKEDPRISIKLEKQGLNFESVVGTGETIFLLDNANLSTGGESIDVTSTIHPDFKKLAIQVTKDMGLSLCGVDFMTKNIELPLGENKDYIILELNGAPGLDNYLSAGETQRNYVKDLYRKILISLSENE